VGELFKGSIFENFKEKEEKALYFRCIKTNELGIDGGLLIPFNKISFVKSNEDLKTFQMDLDREKYLFAGIQIKNDIGVTIKEYNDIVDKWYKKKKEIETLWNIHLKKKVNFLFFIFNESFDEKTGKTVKIGEKTEWKVNMRENDVIVFFTDIKNKKFSCDAKSLWEK